MLSLVCKNIEAVRVDTKKTPLSLSLKEEGIKRGAGRNSLMPRPAQFLSNQLFTGTISLYTLRWTPEEGQAFMGMPAILWSLLFHQLMQLTWCFCFKKLARLLQGFQFYLYSSVKKFLAQWLFQSNHPMICKGTQCNFIFHFFLQFSALACCLPPMVTSFGHTAFVSSG